MTEVLHSPSHFPSSPASTTFFHGQTQPYNPNPNPASSSPAVPVEAGEGTRGGDGVGCGGEGGSERTELKSRKDKEREDLSLLTLLVAVFRKSLVACKASTTEDLSAMDIGWPTNVRHVAHVTFDRFNGFLGLPVEFEPEVPMRAPSASTSVFGVSTESMQLSYDSRGNCVPTILVLMQRRLYAQGGLQAEGIFRINAENSQEEFVRDQLNRGIIPDDIDVHCLAGLIKAWFRELPTGVLDTLSPEQVMQCETEEDCTELVRLLPATEASLLDWAINLMADVVQQEQFNKMNAHNIAMVFAPNMTQMVDPLTALMFAVQVMNFLKTLIMKTLQEREELQIGRGPTPCLGPFDDSGHQSPSQPPIRLADNISNGDNDDVDHYSTDDEDEPAFDSSHDSTPLGDSSDSSPFQWVPSSSEESRTVFEGHIGEGEEKHNPGQSGSLNGVLDTLSPEKEFVNECGELLRAVTAPVEKCKAVSNLSRISSRTGLTEAWR